MDETHRKKLRSGFTTGACAAAAARGAALMLREQTIVDEVEINLPTGGTALFRLQGQKLAANRASCFVVKDAGDDPDVTNGAEIHVTVKVDSFTGSRILIEGGPGIGRVTKPGLAVPVGEWAINPVPRRMLLEAVKEVFPLRGTPVTFTIIPSIPDGEERARKTLNSRLGIIGGLSLLGTTGIVRPVSTEAWTATIDTAIDVALACGCETIVLSTGRTSELVAQKFLGTRNADPDSGPEGVVTRNSKLPNNEALPEEAFVMMGDHVAHALHSCARKGVGQVVIAGQFAKLVKIACGHGQTHAASAELDLRTLVDWLNREPRTAYLEPLLRAAATARQVLEDSGRDRTLIALVCGKVRESAAVFAPNLGIKVLLAGYDREMLYCG